MNPRGGGRASDVVLADARRRAARILREAERDAALVRREAAAWAATTRREVDEYREQVVRDLEARARQLEEQFDEVDTVVIDLLGRADAEVAAGEARRITAR